LTALVGEYEVRYIFPEDLGGELPVGATMVLVGSGGVEEMVKASIDRLPPMVMLIADGLKNSLAASLEILSWMRLEGRNGRVVHGDVDYMMRCIADYVAAHDAVQRLRGSRVGVIGRPSGWLIASNVDYGYLRDSWGVELVDLPLDEVVSNYKSVAAHDVDDEVSRLRQECVGYQGAYRRRYQQGYAPVPRHRDDGAPIQARRLHAQLL
jgi:L-fucose isomerase-like protein